MHSKKGEKEKGNGRRVNNTSGESSPEENETELEQEWNEEGSENWELSVIYTGNGGESLSDLDMEEIENYGADSEVEQFSTEP